MGAYHYLAIHKESGQEQKGVLEAESEREVRELLRDKSLFPIKVHLAQKKFSGKVGFSFLKEERALSAKELALITRQFSTLLSAGLPVEEALLAIAEQTEKRSIKGLILSVRGKVLEGHTLAFALSEYPESFSSLFSATVSAGEKSGHLDKVLLRLADYTDEAWQMRQKLKTALIYPTMIVLVSMGIVGFLLEFVVPKMIAVYGNLSQTLPLLTSILIAISTGIKAYGFYGLLILVMFLYFFRRRIKKNEAFRIKIHHLLLRLPLFGYALKTIDTARFARTLSILSASGVAILEAMTISAKLIAMLPIRRKVEEALKKVKEGAAIHFALKQTTYFSPMSLHMIASGEASGQLEGMLERVSKNQEEEITRLIEVGLALFEPAIILLMGAIVLFIVLAVLLPIFQLNQFTG